MDVPSGELREFGRRRVRTRVTASGKKRLRRPPCRVDPDCRPVVARQHGPTPFYRSPGRDRLWAAAKNTISRKQRVLLEAWHTSRPGGSMLSRRAFLWLSTVAGAGVSIARVSAQRGRGMRADNGPLPPGIAA